MPKTNISTHKLRSGLFLLWPRYLVQLRCKLYSRGKKVREQHQTKGTNWYKGEGSPPNTWPLPFPSYLESDTADPARARGDAVSHLGRGLPRPHTASSAAAARASAVPRRRGASVGTAGLAVRKILSVSRRLKKKKGEQD